MNDHARADLIFDVGERPWRVQVKWAQLAPRGDVFTVRVRGSYRSGAKYVRSSYHAAEVDLLAAYCGALDRCFLFPIELVAGLTALRVRLTPPRNHQRRCINLAEDFTFNGAVAQLGERRHGMAEVRGSNPLSST